MFARNENSTQDSNSSELFFIKAGPNAWRFNSSEKKITYKNQIYLPANISTNGIAQSGDATDDNVEIMLPVDNTLVTMLVEDRPSVEVKIVIRRKHEGDNDAPIHWIGTLSAYGRTENPLEYKLVAEVMAASFNRNVARMAWSRQCQYALYDRNCSVDMNAHDVNVHIDSLDSTTIKSSDLQGIKAGHFSNGFIQWTNSYDLIQRRSIENNSRRFLTIIGNTSGLVEGMTVKAFPGCARNTFDCDEKFNNLPNYGGFAQMAGKSPYVGEPLW